MGAHLRVLRLLSRNELMVGNLYVHCLLRFERVDGKCGWWDQSWEGLREKLSDVCQIVENSGPASMKCRHPFPSSALAFLESKARRDPIRQRPRLADCCEVMSVSMPCLASSVYLTTPLPAGSSSQPRVLHARTPSEVGCPSRPRCALMQTPHIRLKLRGMRVTAVTPGSR